MSLFDTYIPEPAVACPRCGAIVRFWQGYDAQQSLLHWQQGKRLPVATDCAVEDFENGDVDAALASVGPLPDKFTIYGWCDVCEGRETRP